MVEDLHEEAFIGKKKKGKRVRERLRNLFEVLGTITVKKKKKKKKERERGAEECAAE